MGNAPPSITGAQLVPAVGNRNTLFQCQAVGWQDPDGGDPQLGQYVWFVNGAETAGQTGSTFDAGLASGGYPLGWLQRSSFEIVSLPHIAAAMDSISAK